MVFHELATNVAKYGALSTPEGLVDVVWTMAGDHPPRLELTWTERGGPEVEALPKRGFGTELIERGLRFELQGETKLGVVDGGRRIIIPANSQYITFKSPPDEPITEALPHEGET